MVHMAQKQTRGQIESEISKALIAFEKEHMGRGPLDVKTYIIKDIVVIRLIGVLTPAERHLAKDDEGIQLVKQVRAKLLENSHMLLAQTIQDITGLEIASFHTDISTKTGERFIVITFKQDLEKTFKL